MSDSLEALRNRVEGAQDLQAVVRTMKAMSASSITQYENAVNALHGYYANVQQGLSICLKQTQNQLNLLHNNEQSAPVVLIVFGSDQGLVGQFNDQLAQYVLQQQESMASKPQVWVVGERMFDRLQNTGLDVQAKFNVPSSVKGVTPLIGDLLLATEHLWSKNLHSPLQLFYQKPAEQSGQYKPHMNQLLPIDTSWLKLLQTQQWLGPSLPEVLGTPVLTLHALVREYLFVSMYQACAESLASENASRLIAMQRAEKNIEEMLSNLQQEYHHQRQDNIDAELFDVVAGYMPSD